ncbi:MAG TPA: hypothetical protein VFZ61_17135 [Polyangiales bacterium]
MGLANEIAAVLRRQLKCHVAWLPIANTFALGDYGVFSHGVFTKLGNVQDLKVSFREATSPAAKIDFISDETKVMNLVGDVAVDVIPEVAVNAKIKVEFQKANAFLLRAKTVKVHEIQNVAQAMQALRDHPSWRRAYKLVAKVWIAERAALLTTTAANTSVTLAGSVPALKQFGLGDVSAELRVGTTRELGLQILGTTGVVGLGLVKHKIVGGAGYLTDDDGQAEASVDELAPEPELPADDV